MSNNSKIVYHRFPYYTDTVHFSRHTGHYFFIQSKRAHRLLFSVPLCSQVIDHLQQQPFILGVAMSYLDLLFMTLFFVCSLAMSYVDMRERRLPNVWTAAFFGLAFCRLLIKSQAMATILQTLLLTAFVTLLLALCSLYGEKRNRKLLGMGDVKLTASLTLWFSGRIIELFILACLGALLFMLIPRLKGQNARRVVPFAPFLLASGWLLELKRLVK